MRFLICLFIFSLLSCNINKNNSEKNTSVQTTDIANIDSSSIFIDTFFYEINDVKIENYDLHYCNRNPKEKVKLSSVKVSYLDLNGKYSTGELIVHTDVSSEVVEIFRDIFNCEFRIEKMIPIFNYECSDDKSMGDNNTSAFNYRTISGSRKLSDHSFGKAIDINPIFNPHVKKNKILPQEGEQYLDRNKWQHGMIQKQDCVVEAFKSRGWQWGGDWKYSKDYQHFYKY